MQDSVLWKIKLIFWVFLVTSQDKESSQDTTGRLLDTLPNSQVSDQSYQPDSQAAPLSSQDSGLASDAGLGAVTPAVSLMLEWCCYLVAKRAVLTSLKQKKSDAKYICMNSPDRCKEFLEKEINSGKTVKKGFCVLSPKAPTKDDGYAQVSGWGGNKFASLQQVLAWAGGYELGLDQQCSHRCHEPLCLIAEHVCVESGEDNNRRKGCLVVWRCAHCTKYYLVCPHSPSCIKYVEGYSSWEDFLENGLHE